MATPKDFKFSNETQNLNSQCKVVVYPWNSDLSDVDISDAELSGAGRLDISSQIESVSFQKNTGNVAGSFSIQLTSSPNYGSNDWKDIIKRGYWIVIWMSNDGDLILNPQVGKNLTKNKKKEAHKIRCIGYVDRVAVQGATGEKREISIGFTVTGRDFGVVYENCDIWHNLFKFDKIMLDSLATTKLNVTAIITLDEAMKIIHNLFYYPANIPGAKLNDKNSLLSIGLQWLLPRQMLQDVGMDLTSVGTGTFWGNLPNIMEFSKTNANISINDPASFLNGNAWEQLKKISIPQFHELFAETRDDGTPRLVFRPIPWGIDQSGYPNNAPNITLYKDLKPLVHVPALDILEYDMGEEDHARYNSFMALVTSGLMNVNNCISLLEGSEFPYNNFASIRRHGLRRMHVEVDSIINNSLLANGQANSNALIEFNEILYDYWNNAVFAESGTVTKVGRNDTKIGKACTFRDDVPYLNGRRYYIEGYTDSFHVNEKGVGIWTQTLDLTYGFEQTDLQAKSGFANRTIEFVAPGEYTKRNGGTK
jgi:hypothetical protein